MPQTLQTRVVFDECKRRACSTFDDAFKIQAELKQTRPHLFRDMVNPADCCKINNQQDVEDLRNNMAQGNYPLSMSDCEVIGINGDCGPDCLVLLRGDCDCEDEMRSEA